VIVLKTKNRNISTGVCLILSSLLIGQFQYSSQPRAQQNAPQPTSLKVNAKNIGGAFELPAETLLYGDVRVFLPDDMAAGDTISGTVMAEPKGNTEEERAKNRDTLQGFVVEIGEQKVPVSKGVFKWVVPATPKLIRIIDGASGNEVAKTQVPLIAPMPKIAPSQNPRPGDFRLPAIGQQGRAVEIAGPFDGDFSNTTLDWKATQDFEKNTENVSGGFGLIAESPRKAVFRSPYDITGPVEINLKEGSVETKGVFRNVGVRLSAPKTNLQKGEKTTLTVEVVGLAGIQTGVPLQIDSRGVINMEGGNFQNMLIPTTSILPGGRFTMTRTITGQQAGAFSVTATVIVKSFDVCLADDSDRHRGLSWNTFTGDYIFTNLVPAGQPKPPDTVTPPPGSINLTGTGKPAMKGCIITLTHNAPDRRVFARLDVCSQTADASVETSTPKSKLTITDKNTSDNACAAAR
jgi:hypothetical protein